MSEDFEFKPLTEGLGFHKKVIDLKEKEETSVSGKASSSSFHPSVNSAAKTVHVTEPGARKASRIPSSSTDTTWKPTLPKANIDEAAQGLRLPQLIPVAASWPAAVFDTTMVLGLTLIFSAAVFAVTHIYISNLILMIQTDGAAQAATAAMIISVFEIYSVTCRTFFGKTLGEWTFEYRLGSYAQQQQVLYPLKVAWRGLVTAITGFVLLPALSTVLRKDVAGILSGTSVFLEKR